MPSNAMALSPQRISETGNPGKVVAKSLGHLVYVRRSAVDRGRRACAKHVAQRRQKVVFARSMPPRKAPGCDFSRVPLPFLQKYKSSSRMKRGNRRGGSSARSIRTWRRRMALRRTTSTGMNWPSTSKTIRRELEEMGALGGRKHAPPPHSERPRACTGPRSARFLRDTMGTGHLSSSPSVGLTSASHAIGKQAICDTII